MSDWNPSILSLLAGATLAADALARSNARLAQRSSMHGYAMVSEERAGVVTARLLQGTKLDFSNRERT